MISSTANDCFLNIKVNFDKNSIGKQSKEEMFYSILPFIEIVILSLRFSFNKL